MSKDYPGIYKHLTELMARLGAEAAGVMRGFAALHSASTADGALPTKTKELIALAIGIPCTATAASPTTSMTPSTPARHGRRSWRRSAWR